MVAMSRGHYEFIADLIGPQVAWPSHLHTIADHLEETNPKFNRERFLARAIKAWEGAQITLENLDDEIPY
jgi:hypothetical protein